MDEVTLFALIIIGWAVLVCSILFVVDRFLEGRSRRNKHRILSSDE
jgi:hypothetical protein